jgi:hypothetical protein
LNFSLLMKMKRLLWTLFILNLKIKQI